jgi:exosome complex RNA-binding protein Csl4
VAGLCIGFAEPCARAKAVGVTLASKPASICAIGSKGERALQNNKGNHFCVNTKHSGNNSSVRGYFRLGDWVEIPKIDWMDEIEHKP